MRIKTKKTRFCSDMAYSCDNQYFVRSCLPSHTRFRFPEFYAAIDKLLDNNTQHKLQYFSIENVLIIANI